MLTYIIKRILVAIPTLIGLSVLIFFLIRLAPGDPAIAMLGEHASESSVKELRANLGLDKPIYMQYLIFLQRLAKLDFGTSIKTNEAVLTEFLDRFVATAELALVALIIAVIIGVTTGIIAAVKRYSVFDYTSMFLALAGFSMPIFWLGLMMIYFFAVTLGWFPVSGRLGFEYDIDIVTGFYLIDAWFLEEEAFETFGSVVHHLIMPAIALSTVPMSIIARITRASMIEVMKEDYIRTAKAKGCSSMNIVLVHALRNALIPIVTIIGLMVGLLFSGAVLTETIFAWPGIGKWLVNAVYQRDFPVIQGATLLIGVLFITVNLIIDIFYSIINPKIRLAPSAK